MGQIKKQSKKRSVTIIIVIILLALAISFVVYSYTTESFIFAKKQRSETTSYTYTLDEMVINLKNQGHYLKTTIALGYSLEEDLDFLLSKEVQIRDIVISILRAKTVEDIMPVENTDALKDEMLKKINNCFDEEIITDVYITNFIVQ